MKNFKKLLIWQKGFQIAISSFKLVSSFPKEEKYGISSQITRAAVSIVSNIAEGSSRNSTKDYKRFLEMSLGSAYELETQLMIAQAVNFGNKEEKELLLKDIVEEQKMLIGFMRKIEQDSKANFQGSNI
ncbi:MAG: four helix bundle protein [Bacteroidetes bacterium]|nr:four helix bundle protein [Bacteroidota bacterium]